MKIARRAATANRKTTKHRLRPSRHRRTALIHIITFASLWTPAYGRSFLTTARFSVSFLFESKRPSYLTIADAGDCLSQPVLVHAVMQVIIITT